jgi:hypothetical protein
VEIINTVMWVCLGLGVVLGVPFTLLWWRDMDKWANAEDRKFKPKASNKPVNKVVVKFDAPPAPDAKRDS